MNKSSLISAATAIAMTLCAWLPARSAEEMSAYLFAYFTGNNPEQEQICYAVSYDGFNYLPLNSGNPIISSAAIANTGCVRDPHILRGNDGYFYMVATDMKSSLGWQSNHGLVLMRSTDLINWTHHAIDFQVIYPDTKFANSKYVWAPQTIWDESAGKYMIYFAWGDGEDVGTGSSAHQIPYYVYANSDFTDLEKGADGKYVEPKVLFDRGFAAIDMDIVLDDDDIYHCFYKDEATAKGITQCTFAKGDLHDSSKWNYDYPKISYAEAAEGCGVFRLRDGNWCLMWDCYNNGHYCFTRSSDLNTFEFVQYTATSGTFTPRHGTVIQITQSELDALLNNWGYTKTSADNDNITKAESILSSTNVYNPTGSNFIYGIQKLRAAYEADNMPGTMFDCMPSGWRNLTVPVAPFLMSAWGGIKEGSEYWDGLHVNSWSNEGDTDGSDFKIPFYEYWTGDANSLAQKEITGTVPGLTPGQLYKVTGIVRVRLKDGVSETPTGITLRVGDGSSVNVSDGLQVKTSQFYLKTATAYGYTDNDGNLKITFSVADGNNISWLSFKNMNYAESTVTAADSHSDWMSYIPNDIYISNLSLPGAHDAASSGFSGAGKTQDKTISQQLAAGVRVFDLRTAINGSNLCLAHGDKGITYNYITDYTFNDALGYIEKFLNDNPSEFAIVFTKKERSGDNSDTWKSLMKSTVDAHAASFVPFRSDLTVGDMRGKILLLNRDEFVSYKNYGFATNWSDNQAAHDGLISTERSGFGSSATLKLQDFYNVTASGATTKKDDAVRALLSYSTSHFAAHKSGTNNNWAMNHTSGYSQALTSNGITNNANRCNKVVIDYLNDASNSVGPTGIIMMDYAGSSSYYGQDLVDAIIANNFKYIHGSNDADVCYLYNVEAQKFLTQGSNWDTRAVVSEHSAPIYVMKNGNKYAFHLLNVTNEESNSLNIDGYNTPYTDQGFKYWTITDAGDGNCTIGDGTNNLGCDLTTGCVTYGGDNTTWRILTQGQMHEMAENASVTNPVDVTGLISGATWHRNNNEWSTAWSGDQPDTKSTEHDSSNHYHSYSAEWYNKNFTFSQSVYLPKGTYRLSCVGFYRNGERAAAISNYGAGNDKVNAMLFAGETTAKIRSIFSASNLVESSDIVDDQDNATATLLAGNYRNSELYFDVETDGYVDLGIKKTTLVYRDWTVISGFSLTAFGQNTSADEIDINRMIEEVQQLLKQAATYQGGHDDVVTALNAAVTQGNAALATEIGTELKAAKAALVTAIEQYGIDIASPINPFDVSKKIGAWKNGIGAQNFQTLASADGEYTGQYFESWNADPLAGKVFYQNVTGLLDGYYLFRACVMANAANCAYLYCGEGKSAPMDIASQGHYMFVLGHSTGDSLEFGLKQDDATSKWMAIADWKLEYLGKELPVTSNLDFAKGTAIDNIVCTYAKDMGTNNTTYSQAQPVKGWITVSNGDQRAGATYAYGSAHGLGDSKYKAPTKDPDNKDGKGLGTVAVWKGSVQYIAPIELAPGEYTLTIPVYNTDGSDAPAKSYIGFAGSDGVNHYAESKLYSNSWTNESVTFTVTEKTLGAISLGYLAGNVGSGKSQKLFFDEVKLTRPTNTFTLTDDAKAMGETNFFAGNATDGYKAEKVVLTDGYVYGNDKDVACNDITYVRDFLNTNWQALYVPFAVNAATVAAQGQLLQLASVEDTGSGYVLHFNTITSGTLAPHEPYIFKPSATGEMIFTATSNLEHTVENSIAKGDLTLYGTYQGKTDMFTSKAYGLANDKFMRAESDAAILKPFRIYLMVNSGAAHMPSQIGVAIDEEETDALNDALFFSDDQGTCYDLQGRIVKNPSHGIIIQNGKKQIAK